MEDNRNAPQNETSPLNLEELVKQFESFSLDQFMADELFAKLYDVLKENTSQTKRDILIEKASLIVKKNFEIGKSAFKAAYQKYEKAQLQTNGAAQPTTKNKTQFTEQPLELNCGPYECTDAGIVRKETLVPIQVSYTPMMPIAKLINVENGKEFITLGYKNAAGNWCHTTVPASELLNRKDLQKLSDYGVGVTSENAGQVVSFIDFLLRNNTETIPVGKTISHGGYYGINGFFPYVTDPEERIELCATGRIGSLLAAVHTKGDGLDAWTKIVAPLREYNLDMRAFIAASFSAPLVQLVGMPSFFCHLCGPTSKGKTLSLIVASSVWANPDPAKGHYITNFSSTENALDYLANALQNLPLAIDELQSRTNLSDIETLVYRLTDATGKDRAAKNGGVLDNSASRNTTFLSTGEFELTALGHTSGGGALARVINLVSTGDTPLFISENGSGSFICNAVKQCYGWAGEAFIKWVMEHKDAIITMYNEVYNEVRPQSGKIISKLYDAVSLLILADRIANKVIFKNGADDSEAFKDHLLAAIKEPAQTDPHRATLEWLMCFIGEHQSKFVYHNDGDQNWDASPYIDYLGVITPAEIAISKEVLDKQYAFAHPKSKITRFIDWAIDEGYASRGTDRKYAGRVFVPKRMSTPCYIFNRKKLPSLNDSADTNL